MNSMSRGLCRCRAERRCEGWSGGKSGRLNKSLSRCWSKGEAKGKVSPYRPGSGKGRKRILRIRRNPGTLSLSQNPGVGWCV